MCVHVSPDETGKTWNEGIGELIQEFNGGSGGEHKKVSALEASVIKMYPTLHQATQDLVAYHWSNFESKTSALTLKIIGSEVLRPLAILDGIFSFQVQKLCCIWILNSFFTDTDQGNGAKPKVDSDLWKEILAPNNDKRHMWISRKVRYFVHRLAEAKRLRKKINLHSNAQSFRDVRDDADSWQPWVSGISNFT